MKKCVLIYDDDTEILEVSKTILEKKYNVETRSRCDDILKDIEDINPDIIFMDLWIPEIGGAKAITLVKHDENINTIPVIIFSANPEIAKLSESVYADAYLKKPFDMHELVSMVDQYIST